MNASQHTPQEMRVAILAPTGRDAALTAQLLGVAEIATLICPDIRAVEQAVTQGVGVLLVAEEAMLGDRLRLLEQALADQPAWSDLPVLLLTRYGADSAVVAHALQALGNVALLERPVRPATLLSSVRTAMKARDRQYQVRSHLLEQARIEESLRDADRRKDEFLATLAHELRNPLAPIRNSMHILRLTGKSNPAANQVCEMIERQVGHLVRLVDDLMEVSRITRGKVELRRETLDLAAVVRSAVEASRPLIDDYGHDLAVSLPSEPLVVFGDPVRLSQVFANLLNNAAKYMNRGGRIWLSVRRRDDRVLISVRDTGIGIAADMLPQIFKMFTQVDRSSRQAQGGLGIGLTLVRTLVEMHDGEVTATSGGIGQGSEFTVSLPLSVESGRSENARAETSPELPKQRVLVVDDNRDAGQSLGMLLRLLNADVRIADSGPAALGILETYRPTVVLLDIGMPGMDGYEVARRIRQHPEWRDLLLIALTGWGQEEDRLRSQQAGFDHHLLKPADVGALKALLRSGEGAGNFLN